jgi:hypothetical protein
MKMKREIIGKESNMGEHVFQLDADIILLRRGHLLRVLHIIALFRLIGLVGGSENELHACNPGISPGDCGALPLQCRFETTDLKQLYQFRPGVVSIKKRSYYLRPHVYGKVCQRR